MTAMIYTLCFLGGAAVWLKIMFWIDERGQK